MRMRNLMIALSALLFAVLPTALHAGNVKTDWDHRVVWEKYHTFSFDKIQSDNPFYVDRIRRGITHYLQQQGWKRVNSGADATIFVLTNVENQQSVQTFYDGMGGGWGWGGWPGWGWGMGGPAWSTSQPVNQRVRMVVVDIYDTQTKKLLWRGTANDDLSDKTSRNTRALYVDFADMFHNFPPKKG